MHHKIAGIALFEVMLSIGLLALVLLSLLSYQINLIKSMESTNYKNIANDQINNFAEMLLIDKTERAREKALSVWNKDNQHLLPNGQGDYDLISDHVCQITLRWYFKKQELLSNQFFC